MSGTSSSDTSSALNPVTGSTGPGTTTGPAPGGGGSGGTSVGGSTTGLTLPELPPQYATGNLGFPTRQTEAVPTSVTVGPDGALYVGMLTGIPYGDGYAYVARIDGTNTTTGYNGTIASGVPQTYASGFSQINGLAFNNSTGDMYVLEYVNSNSIYDPTQTPADLPPSLLIQVAPDGTRTTISGPELHLGNYVTVNQQTGDVYVAIDNQGPGTATSPGTGEVLDYKQDPTTGQWNSSVIASGLNGPRGMAIGPDGNLYVLEQGTGTPSGDPGASTAPVIPFLPGLVSERGGDTGSITRVDLNSSGQPTGSQQTVLTGLSSFREFNPTTGQDRVISIGMNGMTIEPDGTIYIAAGGGLAPETAQVVGPLADELQGVLKVSGLFGSDPSQATVTPEFNSLTEAQTQGPDGATTQFNTESNLNDITYDPSSNQLYAVDAARNTMYGLSSDGSTVNSATVFQKQPPILTPPQYAASVEYGGNPSQQYAAEISNYTYKDANDVPNVPGNLPPQVVAAAQAAAAAALGGGAPPGSTSDTAGTLPTGSAPGSTSDTAGTLPMSGTSGSASDTAGTLPMGSTSGSTSDTASAVPTNGLSGSAPATSDTAGLLPPHGEDTQGPGVTGATLASSSDTASSLPTGSSTPSGDSSSSLPTVPTSSGLPAGSPPVPVDPVSPPVLADNAYSQYFNPFFGNLAPAAGDPLLLPAGDGSTYSVSKLVVFGDRFADNGNAASLDESLGQAPNFTSEPYSSTGDFTDGAKWTTDLAQILGATSPSQQENFAYENATARDLGVPNPFDPNASKTPLDTFAGQIQQFEQQDGSFSPNELVSITFGGNDISLPSTESPDQGITDSVNAIISGMDQLAGLGAKHFLVSNLPDITLAPLFSQPAFLQATGATQAGFQGLVNSFNTQLSSALTTFQQQTGTDVKTLDLHTLFNGIAANPTAYGFSNITQPILTSTPGVNTPVTYNPAIVGQDPTVQHGSLFLDPYFDPTALGQTIVAQTARSTLTA